ncbi:hypothetical protein C2845_PM17G08440 [Panicum miliaceum]|uniref:Uncharacterized protein n=1 Tax=Panicum miliaceum TaxID=4540 RepID=A0A3L6Q1M1_PANMI|nr:hypothetical protein C2845_PM17G08440 [Panicum miliaceum]
MAWVLFCRKVFWKTENPIVFQELQKWVQKIMKKCEADLEGWECPHSIGVESANDNLWDPTELRTLDEVRASGQFISNLEKFGAAKEPLHLRCKKQLLLTTLYFSIEAATPPEIKCQSMKPG